MDMAAWLDEMTYRLLVCAEDHAEAEKHLAIVARWTRPRPNSSGAARTSGPTTRRWWPNRSAARGSQ